VPEKIYRFMAGQMEQIFSRMSVFERKKRARGQWTAMVRGREANCMLQPSDVQRGRLKIKSIRRGARADLRLTASACNGSSADVEKPPC